MTQLWLLFRQCQELKRATGYFNEVVTGHHLVHEIEVRLDGCQATVAILPLEAMGSVCVRKVLHCLPRTKFWIPPVYLIPRWATRQVCDSRFRIIDNTSAVSFEELAQWSNEVVYLNWRMSIVILPCLWCYNPIYSTIMMPTWLAPSFPSSKCLP